MVSDSRERSPFDQAPARDYRERSLSRFPEPDPHMPDLSMARELRSPSPERPPEAPIDISSDDSEAEPLLAFDVHPGLRRFPIPQMPPATIPEEEKTISWVPALYSFIWPATRPKRV